MASALAGGDWGGRHTDRKSGELRTETAWSRERPSLGASQGGEGEGGVVAGERGRAHVSHSCHPIGLSAQ